MNPATNLFTGFRESSAGGATCCIIPWFITPNETGSVQTVLKVKAPNKWSAEFPYRYTLVAELKDKKNRTVEMVSTIVGFRKVVFGISVSYTIESQNPPQNNCSSFCPHNL